jgi:hypothetical protein
MRINDLLIESTNQLDEGPKFNKFGQAIGNVAGMAAKGVGAVAGGIAGLGAAAKKGFQAGKSQVAAADDGPATGKPIAKKAAAGATGPGTTAVDPATGGTTNATGGQTTGAPAKGKGFLSGVKAGLNKGLSALSDPSLTGGNTKGAKPAAGGTTTPPSATDINKAGPKGTAPAKPIQGTVAKQAAAKTGAALAGQDQAQAGQTMYSQVKANVDKLDKKGKQRILQLLQKSLAQPAAEPGAMGQVAGQLAKGSTAPNTMANAPVSKTNTAKPGNPNAAPTDTQAKGLPPGVNPEKANAANIAAGMPPIYKQTADGGWEETDQYKGTWAGDTGGATGITPAATTKKRSTKKTQPEMAGKINTGSMVLEGFNLFRKK